MFWPELESFGAYHRILVRWQPAPEVVECFVTGVWLMGSVVLTDSLGSELPPPSSASSEGSTGMMPYLYDTWLCK